MKKSLLFIMTVMVLSLLLTSCPDPGSGAGSTTYTISGRITDEITGLPVSDVKVGFGPYTAATETAGNYSIEVVGNEAITGNFYLSKGTDYNFIVLSGIDITPVTDLVYDLTISPPDINIYTLHTISGRVYQSDGTTEIADGSNVSITVLNENGGSMRTSGLPYDSASGGYSIDTATFGSSCTLFIEADDSTPFTYYIENVDLSATSVTLNLTKPSTGYSTVTVTGIDGSGFTGSMKYSETAYFKQVENSLSGTTTANVEIYNPDGKPFYWSTTIFQADTPSAGDSSGMILASTPAVPGSSVTLPVPVIAAPTEVVLGSSINYSTGTLSFPDIADSYFIVLEPQGALTGAVYSLSSTVPLPDDINAILTSPFDSLTSWDATVWSMNNSPAFDIKMTNIWYNNMGVLPDFGWSPTMSASPSSTDLIP